MYSIMTKDSVQLTFYLIDMYSFEDLLYDSWQPVLNEQVVQLC